MLIKEINENPEIMSKIKDNIWQEIIPIKNLEKLDSLELGSAEYNKLYNKIIKVGEYTIPKDSYTLPPDKITYMIRDDSPNEIITDIHKYNSSQE